MRRTYSRQHYEDLPEVSPPRWPTNSIYEPTPDEIKDMIKEWARRDLERLQQQGGQDANARTN